MHKHCDIWLSGYRARVTTSADVTYSEFKFPKEDEPFVRVTVSVKYDYYHEVLAHLLHELVEFLLVDAGASYRSDRSAAHGSDCRRFMFDHPQFSEVMRDAAVALSDCQDFVRNAWRAAHKE